MESGMHAYAVRVAYYPYRFIVCCGLYTKWVPLDLSLCLFRETLTYDLRALRLKPSKVANEPARIPHKITIVAGQKLDFGTSLARNRDQS